MVQRSDRSPFGLQAKKDVDSSGLPIMTAAALRQARACPVAIDDEGYETPELNDRLYLHFKVQHTTSPAGLLLISLLLMAALPMPTSNQLRCLYLERNLISRIKGLKGLESLVQLDLSQNRIEAALGLSCLPSLHTLNLSKNSLGDAAAVSPLSECPSLTNLDVTGNRLAGPGVLDVLSSLKGLVSLSLSGNPILAETAHFRKTVITASPKLRYQEEKRNEDRRQMQVFRDWQAEMRQKKLAEIEARAAAGLGAPEPTPEEVLREADREAEAKADAEEDKRLIKESLAGAAASSAGSEGPLSGPPSTVGGGASSMSTATASETGDCNGGSDPNFSGTGRAGSHGGDDGGGDRRSDSSFDDEEERKGGREDDERRKDHSDDDKDEHKEDREEGKNTERDGEEEEEEEEEEDEEDEKEIRRVRVAQSLAMYRSQLAAERRLEEANLLRGHEEKTPRACVWSPPGSPSRHRGGGAVAGGFQRRLEEASAEVSAEAAASPQIVAATSGPRGCPAENTQQTQRHRGEQVPFPGATEGSGKCDPGGGVGGGWSGGRQWTASKDRALARLVRECEFDFDLVAARFSSAIAGGDGGGEEEAVTAQECRVRFARFDREEEDNTGDDMGGGGEAYNHNLVPDLDAIPAPGVIENAGLSFADLERKARNMKSRFLEPPKDLPSTRDADDRLHGDDDTKDGAADDVDDGRDLITKKKRTTTDILSSGDADGCAGKDYAIREDGARVGATKEPVLLVINDPGTATADGGRGNFERNRSGDSGSDGEDDEV
ncbi:unnamed protein product, partial [Ectocarpus sp. 13 AM-2016]